MTERRLGAETRTDPARERLPGLAMMVRTGAPEIVMGPADAKVKLRGGANDRCSGIP